MKRKADGLLFFRIFFTVLGISALIVLCELAVFFSTIMKMGNRWTEYIARDYVQTLVSLLDGKESLSAEDVYEAIVAASDDSISGLLIRSFADDAIYMYGGLPENGQGRISRKLSEVVDTGWHSFEKNNPVYVLSLAENENGGYSHMLSALGTGSGGRTSVTYSVPSFIGENDIAATVFIEHNEDLLVGLDLLIFDMYSFGPTSFVLDTILLTAIWLIPLSLVIAVAASFVFSRRTSDSVGDILSALRRMSDGDFDVSIRKQKTYELNEIGNSIVELSHQLEKNRRSRDEWIRSIAHDLNTPLTSMNMIIQAIEDGIYEADGKTIASLKNEVETLTRRVLSVRYYVSLLNYDSEVRKDEINAAKCVEQVVSLCPSPGRISIEIGADEMIHADSDLFSHALGEVISNALEYGSKDEQISVRAENNTVYVTDKGRLSNTDASILFEPWARGDESRHEGGSGLGLPIAGQIASLHGGYASIRQDGSHVVVALNFGPVQG